MIAMRCHASSRGESKTCGGKEPGGGKETGKGNETAELDGDAGGLEALLSLSHVAVKVRLPSSIPAVCGNASFTKLTFVLLRNAVRGTLSVRVVTVGPAGMGRHEVFLLVVSVNVRLRPLAAIAPKVPRCSFMMDMVHNRQTVR